MRFLARLKERRQIKKATRIGDISTVHSMLETNPSLVTHNKFGHHVLYLAARYGHRDVAELLIRRGADVNWKGDDLFSPLGYAVRYGHSDLVELLLASGARIYQGENFFTDHLGLAIYKNHAGIVRILAKHGMCINRMVKDGTTPLHWAAQSGKLEVVRALLECGADINAKVAGQFPPIHYAKLYRRRKVVELLKRTEVDRLKMKMLPEKDRELMCPRCGLFVSQTTPCHSVLVCPCGCIVRIENYKVASD